MTSRLSHSAIARYLKCPESYKLHYVDKLRPKVTSAALLFGSALDVALNSLLLNKGDHLDLFYQNWNKGYINKQLVELRFNTDLVYATKDFDERLLNSADLLYLTNLLSSFKLGFKDPIKAYKAFNAKSVDLTDKDPELINKYLNAVRWACLLRKGELILDAYKTQILPRIVEVKEVQKEIKFTNEDGDSIIGFIDLIAVLDDGNTYIIDNKTSARPYQNDAVKNSPQLSLYAHHEGLKHAGFIVMQKNIKAEVERYCPSCDKMEANTRVKSCTNTVLGKRCGGALTDKTKLYAEINIITDEVNESLVNIVMSNFDKINSYIKQGIFFKNTDTCTDYYGGFCPYYKRCYNNDLDGLESHEK